MAKVKLFDSAVGKALKVALWLGLSAGTSSLVIWVSGFNWGDLVWLQPTVNFALVTAKNFFDSKVPNLPK